MLELSQGKIMPRLTLTIAAFFVFFTSPVLSAAPMSPYLFDLNAYRGKVVYLDFWASWCGPCKFSFPYMDHIANKFRNQGLVVITDNLDQSSEKAAAFLRGINTSIPVIYDEKGVLASRFNVSDMPTSILIDRTGNIRYVHKGFHRGKEDEYTSHITELLNENK